MLIYRCTNMTCMRYSTGMQIQDLVTVQHFCFSVVQRWAVTPRTPKTRTEAGGRRSTAGVRLPAVPRAAGRTAAKSPEGNQGRALEISSLVLILMKKGAFAVIYCLLQLLTNRALQCYVQSVLGWNFIAKFALNLGKYGNIFTYI